MTKRMFAILAAVLGLAFPAEGGRTAATIAISVRADSFAEWSGAETFPAVSTVMAGRTLHIAQTVVLFANTDVNLEVSAGDDGGVLTCGDGEALPTAWTLTGGHVGPAGPLEGIGEASLYRLRHVPGQGSYDVTIRALATLPEGMTATAGCTAAVGGVRRNSRRLDLAFRLEAGVPGVPEPRSYTCGVCVTASW